MSDPFCKTERRGESFYTVIGWDFFSEEGLARPCIIHEHHDSRGNVVAWDQSPIEERDQFDALHEDWVRRCTTPG